MQVTFLRINAGPEGVKVMTGRDEMKAYTLAPAEIEALLLKDFGGKVHPVDAAKLSKLKQQQANAVLHKTRFSKQNA